jgi:hypothetical protein
MELYGACKGGQRATLRLAQRAQITRDLQVTCSCNLNDVKGEAIALLRDGFSRLPGAASNKKSAGPDGPYLVMHENG